MRRPEPVLVATPSRFFATIFAAAFAAALGSLIIATPASADVVPPFKGNDTGGIISSSLLGQTDFRVLADNHCAQYGKVARFVSHDRRYGAYTSFACRRVPLGHAHNPLRVRY